MKKYMKKISMILGGFALMLAPVITLAQFGQINTFMDDISIFINNTLIPLVFAIALLMFIYGVFKYFILGGHDPEKQKEGRQLMLYSIVGFVVMVSIFGIVNLIAGGLGFSNQENIQNIPNVPTSNTR